MMAHAVVQWTDNLEGVFEVKGFLSLLACEMRDRAGGVLPVGGIRVRAIRISDYVIADGTDPADAFINIDIVMGVGRSDEFKQAFFDALFARATAFLGDLFDRCPLALSLYVSESEGWKHNTIHKRLGKA